MEITDTWLIANWKMHGNAASVRAWAFTVNAALRSSSHRLKVIFCPPAIYLADASAALPPNAQLMLGAQNCHVAEKGAFTGEISAPMLLEAGCGHAILGHSERRAMGETDAQVHDKAQAALAAGLMPIICVGESLVAYEKKQTNAVLDDQLAPLSDLPRGGYLIAYEPVWAIGSNQTPSMAEINAAHSHIKSVLGSETCVLYGGSVNVANAGEILAQPQVSGALIGGASLESERMCALIACAAMRGK
jgi:triosephosphate isomerase